MNSLDIFCFTSVARTRSFSITARELLISQQAVSRHIKVLEDELGFPLFFRTFQSVQLTEAGKLMLQYYMERDSFIAAYQKELGRIRAESCLNIGCSQWLGRPRWFSRLLDRFAACRPEVCISVHDLTAEEIHSFMKTERLDVLLTTRYASRFLPVSWDARPVGEEPIFLLSDTHSSHETIRSVPHIICGESAGEPEPASAKVRIRELADALGIGHGDVRLMPDMGSVCLDTLLRGSLAFVTDRTKAAENPDYTLYRLERSATSVICSPYQSAKSQVRLFLELLDEEDAL